MTNMFDYDTWEYDSFETHAKDRQNAVAFLAVLGLISAIVVLIASCAASFKTGMVYEKRKMQEKNLKSLQQTNYLLSQNDFDPKESSF